MSRRTHLAGLTTLLLGILVPAFAADKDKDDAKDKDTGPKEKRVTVNQFQAKVATVENTGKKFAVSVPVGGGRYAKWQNVDIEAIDDVKVRLANPPIEFDDKGRPKRISSAELKKLKGEGADAKLPGYAADFGQLRQGQIVQVTLTKRKEAPKPIRRGKKGEDDVDDNRPMASLIVIVAEPPPAR